MENQILSLPIVLLPAFDYQLNPDNPTLDYGQFNYRIVYKFKVKNIGYESFRFNLLPPEHHRELL